MEKYKVYLQGDLPGTAKDIEAETPERAAKLFLLKSYKYKWADFGGGYPCIVQDTDDGKQIEITLFGNWKPVVKTAAEDSAVTTLQVLKIEPEFYDAVVCGEKTAELRKNDRDFHVGDYVKLVRADGSDEPASIRARISHIVHGGQYGLAADYCMLSLADISEVQS